MHRINHYPAGKYYRNQLRYPLDSYLSGGWRYPTFLNNWGQVWKRVWILEVWSENGCRKLHFLVWNRVRIWRTGKHTLTKNSHEYPPGLPNQQSEEILSALQQTGIGRPLCDLEKQACPFYYYLFSFSTKVQTCFFSKKDDFHCSSPCFNLRSGSRENVWEPLKLGLISGCPCLVYFLCAKWGGRGGGEGGNRPTSGGLKIGSALVPANHSPDNPSGAHSHSSVNSKRAHPQPPSPPHPGHLSSIGHLVGSSGEEFVRKPLPAGWSICQFF